MYISVCLLQSICKCVYLCISLYLLAPLGNAWWKCSSVCTYMHTHLWVHISAYVSICGPVSTSVSMQLHILFPLWSEGVFLIWALLSEHVCVGGGEYLWCLCAFYRESETCPFTVTISSKVGERNIWLITFHSVTFLSWVFLEEMLITSEMWERSFQKEKKECGDWYNHMETLSIQLSPK